MNIIWKQIVSLFYEFLFILGWAKTSIQELKELDDKRAIIIVQGLFARRGSTIKLERYLKKVHNLPVLSFNFGLLNVGGIRSNARYIQEKIEKLGIENIVLIGHSKGALISLYFTLFLSTRSDVVVERCIMLAAPIQGVSLAELGDKWLGRIFPCLRQMAPGSSLLNEINEFLLSALSPPPIFSIAGTFDEVVPLEKTRGRGLASIEVHADHGSIMHDQHVFHTISALLG